MRKKFKKKKKFKTKSLFLIIFIIIILIFYKYLSNLNFINTNNNILKLFLSSIERNNTYIEEIYKYINKNIFNNPKKILSSELKYDIDDKVSYNTISFLYKENKLPKVYIYNSHQGETYSMEYLEGYNIKPDVMLAANILKEKLDNKNIYTIVEEANILNYMEENNLDHSGSYIASRYFLNNVINKYNSIELYIDLHRDAATHDATYTVIDEKPCAKVLFVIGLEYDTYEKNLKITTDINNIINEKYPTLSRGIMKKKGYGVNGVYNQDLKENIILLEVGGNENNIEEVNNTLDIIASVLEEYLNEKR